MSSKSALYFVMIIKNINTLRCAPHIVLYCRPWSSIPIQLISTQLSNSCIKQNRFKFVCLALILHKVSDGVLLLC